MPTEDPPETPRVLITVGGQPEDIGFALIISSEGLDPDVLTSLLRCAPSRTHRKGDRRGSGPPFPKGQWAINRRCTETQSPDAEAQALLSPLPTEAELWRMIRSEHEVSFHVAVHFDAWNKGFELSHETIARIAGIGASIDLDLYAYLPEESS